ncbi:monocarboxylate transporter 4-like isoform X1 [Amblyomma americanum]
MQRTALKEDRLFGVDSRWSWVTAGFLSWLFSVALLAPQSLGVLFYGIVHGFGVTREEAAWPLVLSASLGSLAGPIMGYVCHRFSCQATLLVSSITTGVALCACGFAQSIPELIFFYGIVHGLAMTALFVTVNVLVSQHFEKRRTTACSLIFFISGLTMLFAPTMAELFRDTYGIRGTFLLLGGITFNACPAVIVLRSPAWMKNRAHSPATKSLISSSDAQVMSSRDLLTSEELEAPPAAENSETTFRKLKSVQHFKPLFAESGAGSVQADAPLPLSSRFLEWKARGRRILSRIPAEFWTLRFVVNSLSFAMVMFGMATFILLLADIAKDRGVPPSRAVFLMNAFGAGDLVFRPLSGLVIDTRVLSLEAVMFLGFLLQAIGFELFVWMRSFSMMLACSILIGVSNGARYSLQAPALVKDFGIESLALLIGGTRFLCGVLLMTRPFLFGYCRDNHGSYDLLLHMVSAANIIFFFAWVVKYFAARRKPQ